MKLTWECLLLQYVLLFIIYFSGNVAQNDYFKNMNSLHITHHQAISINQAQVLRGGWFLQDKDS
ncbi:MAG: hypothetical protein CVU51_09435 [Deltaproteobacteria bacterium HGW-Deltaproteobacteria-1]|nr:MAG: hypothetical protein CVU51_09435 [Deltaproteobacteria bacterium HGW-Deltaproteobacteria-1]